MNQKTILMSVTGVIVLGIAILFFGFKDNDDNLAPNQQSYVVTGTSTDANKNNTYSATVTYRVPSPEQNTISIQITLDKGVVTDVEAKNIANSPQSVQYGTRFMSSYKTEVVGQKLNDINLSRVGGASLTSNAFNAALTAIKAQVG